ncbi:MAG: MerR family transcriptional regulator [Hyphomicrobium sp.]
MSKTADAFRTISEVAGELDVPKHVLRFWEGKFLQVRPMKRGGGRRYYRPEDLELLRGIRHLLHAEGYTIKGVQKILREHGVDEVKASAKRAELAGLAAKAKAKRGRRAIKRASPPSAISPARKAASFSILSDAGGRASIEAAIAELEICRNILLGRKVTGAARRKVSKPRRAART